MLLILFGYWMVALHLVHIILYICEIITIFAAPNVKYGTNIYCQYDRGGVSCQVGSLQAASRQ